MTTVEVQVKRYVERAAEECGSSEARAKAVFKSKTAWWKGDNLRLRCLDRSHRPLGMAKQEGKLRGEASRTMRDGEVVSQQECGR